MICSQFTVIQHRADQKHRRSSQRFRLPDHIFTACKIFPQYGNGYVLRDLFQIHITAQKPVRLCQTGDRRSPRRLIILCDLHVWKILCNDPFGRGGLFYLADKGHPRLAESLFKSRHITGSTALCSGCRSPLLIPEHSLRHTSHLSRRDYLFLLPDPLPRSLRDRLQYIHFPLSLINISSTFIASPSSISCSAFLTPSSMDAALPAI